MIWPIEYSHVLTAGWFYPDGSYHGAIDLRAAIGTPVVAAAPGVIDWVQYWDGKTKTGNQSYGNVVRIRHSDGSASLYAHLNTIIVGYNANVSLGQVIGYSGNTGNSTGPHLHFEVRGRSNSRLQPLNYLDSNFSWASGAVRDNLGEYKSMSGYGTVNDRDTANWDKEDNRFVVEASKGDRQKLKEAIDKLGLPIYDYSETVSDTTSDNNLYNLINDITNLYIKAKEYEK